jgi:hypothetical protein
MMMSPDDTMEQGDTPSTEVYNTTDDLLFLICEVDSHTSYGTLKRQWYNRDRFQDDRILLMMLMWVIPVLFFVIIYYYLDVLWQYLLITLFLVAFCSYSHYLMYHIGKRMTLKSMRVK